MEKVADEAPGRYNRNVYLLKKKTTVFAKEELIHTSYSNGVYAHKNLYRTE